MATKKKSPGSKRRRMLRLKNAIHKEHDTNIERVLDSMRIRLQCCLGIPFELDHIIPVSKGGPHHHLNLQVIPARLNSLKHNDMDYTHPLLIHWTDLPIEIVEWKPYGEIPETITSALDGLSHITHSLGPINGELNISTTTTIKINFPLANSAPIVKKQCVHCLQIKRYDMFRAAKGSSDGLQSWCNECSRVAALKKYYAEKSIYNSRTCEWYRKNKEKKRLELQSLDGVGLKQLTQMLRLPIPLQNSKPIVNLDGNKTCHKCGEEKPTKEHFKLCPNSRDGWHFKCNECRCAYAKEHSKQYKRNKKINE